MSRSLLKPQPPNYGCPLPKIRSFLVARSSQSQAGVKIWHQDQDTNDQPSNFSLDLAVDKEKLEARIAHSIANQVPGLDEKEVESAVKEQYEELLAHTKVKQHVPTLAEGEARARFQGRQLEDKER
jgi:hypothetical protein